MTPDQFWGINEEQYNRLSKARKFVLLAIYRAQPWNAQPGAKHTYHDDSLAECIGPVKVDRLRERYDYEAQTAPAQARVAWLEEVFYQSTGGRLENADWIN